jgi:arsenite methyltransferase
VLKRLGRHLGQPEGRLGRAVMRLLNRANRGENREAVDALALRRGDRVLDLGFGGGVGLVTLLRTPASLVVGVERSRDQLAVARRRFASELAAGRLALAEGSAAALPYPDASFDAVLTVNTLQFWPDAAAGAREVARVLAPGGRLSLVVPTPEALRSPLFSGVTAHDEGQLEALLRGAGFADVRVRRDGPRLHAVAALSGP